jgi:CPA2 family monovalent cation:H+ antiporter-2
MVFAASLLAASSLGVFASPSCSATSLPLILTVILPGLSPSSHENFAHVAFGIAKSLLLLIPIAAAAWKFVSRLLSRVEKTCNDEISLLLALTICLAIAALVKLVLPRNRPARNAPRASEKSYGFCLINPQSWITSWPSILLLVGNGADREICNLDRRCVAIRYSTGTATRVGIGLTQIGEFSFILVQVSLSAGLISEQIYLATLAALS